MADKQRFTSGKSHENRQNVDNERSPEQKSDNAGVSRDLLGTSGGIVHAHGNTSNQPGGLLEESPNCRDNQSVAESSNLNVVNSQGPVQLGAGAAVIHNPTYNYNNQQHHHHHYHPPPRITNTDQYLQWMEQIKAAALRSSATPPGLPPCPVSQHPAVENTTDRAQTHVKYPVYSSHHGTGASFHVPCHCSECLSYHQREHRPLSEMPGLETQSQDSGQTQHQRLPQLLPSSENREQKSSTKKDKQHQETPVKKKQGQRSHRSPQSSPSDVSHDVTRTEQVAEGQAQTTETVRSPDNSSVSRDSIPDSVCIIDSRGQPLEPGDAVWFDRNGGRRWGIYVGGQQVVWCGRSGRHRLVHKGQLELTNPFEKLRVINDGDVRVYPPGERVRRAESRVGREFQEGDRRDGQDFPEWVYSGLGYYQALDRGFGLSNWWS